MRFFLQSDRKGSDTPYGNNEEAGHYVVADDAKLYYEIYGEGKPLLVLQGGCLGSPYELGEFIDKFRNEFKVIVVSTRGHGKSEMGIKPLTFEQRANDLIAILDQISKEPVSIFGFTQMYPERVERIVSIGAGTLKKGFFGPDIKLEDIEKMDAKYINQLKLLAPQPERLQEFFT
ncbi:alpha/beta-hydrolase, partial [Anaeromyces robustus]